MATASHGHIPDLSATLTESRSCAPLSDLWNLPQSKLFPAQSTPVSGTSSVAPSAPPSVPATPPAAATPASGPQMSNYFGSLWAPASQQPAQSVATAPGATQGAPAPGPAPAGPPSSAGVANVGIMAPGGTTGSLISPAYRTTVARGIWGPRDDGFGFRQPAASGPPSASGAGPSASAGAPMATPLSAGSSLMGNQQAVPAQPSFAPHVASANRNYLGGWLDTSPGAAGHSPPSASGPGPQSAANLGIGPMNHAVSPVGAVGSSVVAPVGSPISAGAQSAVISGLPTTPARFSTPSGTKALGAVGVHTSPHSQIGAPGQTVQSSASSTSSTSSSSSAGQAPNRPQKKSGRPSTNTELYKTELCASYMSTGGNCPYGEKCQFAHGTQELKTVDRPPKWRSKPCQNWVKTGSCSYNERCCFRHDVPVCPQ